MTLLSSARVFGVGLAILTAACGGIIDPSKNKTDEFAGTLAPVGVVSHPFTVDKNGEFDAKIIAMSNADALVRLSYGPESNGCTGAVYGGVYTQAGRIGLGGLIAPGRFCVYLSDELGTLSQPATYTLRVSHP